MMTFPGYVAIPFMVLLAIAVTACYLLWRELRNKQMHLWLGSYIRRPSPPRHEGTTHIIFCFVDHYEPGWANPSYQQEVERVARWVRDYPTLAKRHCDADGYPPRHSFFYPEEEYRAEHLDALASLCSGGYGEIEIHLHHDRDTEEGLRDKLRRFTRVLHERHGALSTFPGEGRTAWGFIHGNWALDNSLPDGSHCGINNELVILKEMGCYADFTLPSAPSAAQTSKINSIYYAKDDPCSPKSHDDGRDVRVGGAPWGDLMMVQGPLMLNWTNRKWGLLPRIENGDINGGNLPTPERIELWIKAGIHVRGKPEWLFVKTHTHGAQERHMECLLGAPADRMFSYLEQRYNDGKRYRLHYVSAREMYNIIKAAEAGMSGDPSAYRDFILPPPANCAPKRTAGG